MVPLLQELNTNIAELVDKTRGSLVQITNGCGTGAGTIWHPEGLIITNAHVVGRSPLRIVLPDGTTTPARILAHDVANDVAALLVEASGLPAINLGESRSLKSGQWVLAMGNPWGVVGSVTFGAVIGAGTDLLEGMASGREWVAVNLHLRPGYSGGPLIDSQGRLVGINTMMTSPDIGMAVPVHVVKAFLRRSLGSVKRVA